MLTVKQQLTNLLAAMDAPLTDDKVLTPARLEALNEVIVRLANATPAVMPPPETLNPHMRTLNPTDLHLAADAYTAKYLTPLTTQIAARAACLPADRLTHVTLRTKLHPLTDDEAVVYWQLISTTHR